MTQHTPGPWIAEPFEDKGAVAVHVNAHGEHRSDMALIAECRDVFVGDIKDGGYQLADASANARLIAAAPALLAALRLALPIIESCCGREERRAERAARAAIASVEKQS